MRNQTAMFTSEQMTGSGQTNMIDLINQNEDRKIVLRTTPHTFHADPSHGWLQASYADLKVLGILGAISGCSYRSGDTVYLEEDLDASTYITALFTSHLNRSEEEQAAFEMWRDQLSDSRSENDSFIRNLKNFYR